MNLKRLFCKHQWVWYKMRHVFDSKGYIIKTYYQMRCKKCGKEIEVKNIANFKYEKAEKITSNLHDWKIKKILDGSFWD